MDNEPKCPYCKELTYVDEGPFDDGDVTEIDCDCGKKYSIQTYVTIEWEAKCIPGEHDYVIEERLFRDDELEVRCKNCEEYELEAFPSLCSDRVRKMFADYRSQSGEGDDN